MSLRDTLAALAIAVGSACEGGAPASTPAAIAAPAQVAAANQQISASRRTAIVDAVARVAPAVVTVQTETVERVPVDVFEQFFGGRSGQQVQPGLGSGFIIRPDGVIVTNAHVVAGASRISVMLRDGTTYQATLVGMDEANDLAVIRITARNLPVATLGTSEQLLIGEWAIAIGNPFGFVLGNTEPSVTAGVVSATGRNLLGRSEGNGIYLGMIQTDASINPGNSGGPLVNAVGEVIGVNTSIYTPSGGSIGLGFAIPINRARRIVDDLLDHGSVRRPWIGEKLRNSPSDNPRDIVTAGVIVQSIIPGSPAARAGLQPGDQIVRTRGRALRNVFDWDAERLDMRVGEAVPLVVRRGGREVTLTVTVADIPYHTAAVKRGCDRSFIIADMPFGSYQESPEQAYRNAVTLMAAGAQMVKLEGGQEMAKTVEFLVQRGIPVCAHVGLTPQSVHALGGYKVQGKGEAAAQRLKDDALAVQNAGATMIVLEAIPAVLAGEVTALLKIITIGIGAGKDCSGQVMVLHDAFDIPPGKKAKFVRNFLDGATSIHDAACRAVAAVKDGSYPGPEHTYAG